MANGARRIKITDLNPHLTCQLCGGYYIDATTIIECLHSFCKACIVKYLENSKFCPVCEVQVHKTKPLRSIKTDATLQDMVYKLVPGLFKSEMKRRRDFYSSHPEEAALVVNLEDRGEVHENRFIYTPDEDISLSLEYWDGESDLPAKEEQTIKADLSAEEKNECKELIEKTHRRFLRAPAAVTISHLKKFIRFKYGFPVNYEIDLVHETEFLSDDYTLIDVAYIYSWRRNGPMKLKYRIQDPKISNPLKKFKTSHTPESNCESNSALPSSVICGNDSNISGPTLSNEEAQHPTVSSKGTSTANKITCPPPIPSTVNDEKQKCETMVKLSRTSTPMEVELRSPSVTVTPIMVNGGTNSIVEGDKIEVLNIGCKEINKPMMEIVLKSSVTIEPVLEKVSATSPEPPTKDVIITKVISDDNNSSLPRRTPTPKDSIEIKPTKIVPISTKDVTVKEITTTNANSLGGDNTTKDGNNSVLVLVLSKEPPEVPTTTSNSNPNCHTNGSVSTSPPVHLPVPDISITPIPLWSTPNIPTSSPIAINSPTALRSSASSAAIVRDTLRTTNPQVEIIKKIGPLTVNENGVNSTSGLTSSTPSITTVTPLVMPCNGGSNVGGTPSITISPSTTTIITTSATDTTMTITITSTPVKPSTPTSTSTNVASSVTTSSTNGNGVVMNSGAAVSNGNAVGEDDEPPKHDNIGALDLSRSSRGSHSPQSPQAPRSPRSQATTVTSASSTGVSANGGNMLPPVSTMCFTTPPPSLRIPSQTQTRPVTSKSITLISPAAGAASITTITVPAPNAHSRAVSTASACSSPHHAHTLHAQPTHSRSSHLPINSAHLSALKPSARNCLNGVVAAANARSLQLQQQHHHHHHHHHNLLHPQTHGHQQQSPQQSNAHHYQNRASFPKNIIFGASKTSKKTEQVRHRASSFDKPTILPSGNAFHNGDKAIESGGASAVI